MEVIGGVPEIFLRESLIDKPATWRIPVHLIHLVLHTQFSILIFHETKSNHQPMSSRCVLKMIRLIYLYTPLLYRSDLK